MKQLDLNVQKPESERLPKMYAYDSINWCNLRIYFHEEDEAKVMQVLKDTPAHVAFPAIWNFKPVLAHLTLKNVAPSLLNHWKYTLYLRKQWIGIWLQAIFSGAFIRYIFRKRS